MNTTLRENIDWVGCVDWPVRDFHGYNTDRGATYNAYFIRDEISRPHALTILRHMCEG